MILLRDLVSSSDRAIAGLPAKGAFVKGINLGGEALVIEGNSWDSYENALSAGLSTPKAEAIRTTVVPQPYASPAIRRMLNTVIYQTGILEVEQALPNGTYEVYLWVMENFRSNWHSLEIVLEGKIVATEVGNLAFKHWARYGPYAITVSTDTLRLTVSTNNPNIDAHLMGISIFRLG